MPLVTESSVIMTKGSNFIHIGKLQVQKACDHFCMQIYIVAMIWAVEKKTHGQTKKKSVCVVIEVTDRQHVTWENCGNMYRMKNIKTEIFNMHLTDCMVRPGHCSESQRASGWVPDVTAKASLSKHPYISFVKWGRWGELLSTLLVSPRYAWYFKHLFEAEINHLAFVLLNL